MESKSVQARTPNRIYYPNFPRAASLPPISYLIKSSPALASVLLPGRLRRLLSLTATLPE